MQEPTDSRSRSRRPTALQASAATLAAALTFAAAVPPFASARETESEGEGSGSPGLILPGLEEGFEPGGEETGLGEVPVGPGEGEGEEVPPIPVEEPPAPEAGEAASPTGPEVSSPTVEGVPPVAAPPPTRAAAPVYESEEEVGPSYETAAPPPPAEAVRNEAIVAQEGPGAKATQPSSRPRTEAPSAVIEEAPETGPVEAPAEPPAATPVAAAPTTADRPGSLSGGKEHTVAPGDCLWSIAEGVLPTGASDAEIAAEVSTLRHLNAARIGTGDPSLIYAGTVLRLH